MLSTECWLSEGVSVTKSCAGNMLFVGHVSVTFIMRIFVLESLWVMVCNWHDGTLQFITHCRVNVWYWGNYQHAWILCGDIRVHINTVYNISKSIPSRYCSDSVSGYAVSMSSSKDMVGQSWVAMSVSQLSSYLVSLGLVSGLELDNKLVGGQPVNGELIVCRHRKTQRDVHPLFVVDL